AYTVFSAPNTGGVVLLEAETGKERWKAAFPSPDDPSLSTNWAGGPVLVDDVVIVASGDGLIYAFDVGSGAVRWTLPRLRGDIRGIITTTNREFRALARSGRVLIAGSVTGYIVGYDLDTREERWRYAGGHNGSAAFSLNADGRAAFVPYVSGFLVALDLASGREIWRAGDWRDGFLYPPAASGGRLFVGAARAGYFAFDARFPEVR
ncbi:MAG: PQQ-binding-like beta-propeller repeat protein, partial [Acidobacteria bacterium]|nr:PQQ-binding-like beta-propeller repeat protein [Acidobacteriota bacterium]